MTKTDNSIEQLAEELQDLRDVCIEIYSNTDSDVKVPDYEAGGGQRETLYKIISMTNVYLKLLEEFLYLSPKVLESFPKSLPESSLSAKAYSVWARINLFIKESWRKEASVCGDWVENDDDIKKRRKDESSQTEVVSLFDCEKCDITKRLIKQLLISVESLCSKAGIQSYISVVRQKLRPRLQEMTDWSAITFWSESILTDINNISINQKKNVTKSQQTKSKRKLLNIIRNLEHQLGYGPETAQGKIVKKLKKKISRLKDELEKKIEEANQMAQNVEKSDILIAQLDKELSELKWTSCKDRERFNEFQSKTEDKIKEIHFLKAKYERELKECDEKIKTLIDEKDQKDTLINEQFRSIDSLQLKLKKSKDKESKLMKKLKEVSDSKLNERRECDASLEEQCSLIDSTHQHEDKKNIAEHENVKMQIEVKDPSFSSKSEEGTKLERKTESNQLKISILQFKNKKLQCSMDKINDSRRRKKTGLFQNEIIYHKWMESEELRLQTASDRLTLEQEYEMQQTWFRDENKCTFIVLDKALYAETNNEVDSMIGDVNLYLKRQGMLVGEVSLMIADKAFRHGGRGKEAAMNILRYGVHCIGIRKFVAVISTDNVKSINLFVNLKFSKESENTVFNEITLSRIADDPWIDWLEESTPYYRLALTEPNQ